MNSNITRKDKNQNNIDEYFDYYDGEISDTSDMINESIIKNDYTAELNEIFSSLNEISKNEKLKGYNTLNKMSTSTHSQSIDEVEEYLKPHRQMREVFSKNAKTDRNLKRVYGIVLLLLLVAQLIAVNVVFFLGGLGFLNYTDSTFNLFITGALIEVAVIVRIVVKYLFTDNISKSFDNMMEHSHHKDQK